MPVMYLLAKRIEDPDSLDDKGSPLLLLETPCTIHGITAVDSVAQAWECAGDCTFVIEADSDASVSLEPLPFRRVE